MIKSRILWAAGLTILAINFMFYGFRFGGDFVLQCVSDLLPVICSLTAVVCLFVSFRGFKTFDFIKISWLLLFVGMILFCMGESTYSILEIIYKKDMNENFPSIADVFWCAGYIPLFISLMMMFIGYMKSGFPLGKISSYILLSVAFIALNALIIYYLLIPIISDPESDMLTKVFSLFYPIADLFLVAPALLLMYITYRIGKGTLSRPWKFIAIGFIFFTVADLLYSYLGWKDMYGSGNYIDVAWNAGYLLLGLSAVSQKELLESVGEV